MLDGRTSAACGDEPDSDQAAQHVAELLHVSERFAGLAVARVTEDMERTGAVFDPIRPKAGRDE